MSDYEIFGVFPIREVQHVGRKVPGDHGVWRSSPEELKSHKDVDETPNCQRQKLRRVMNSRQNDETS